MPFVANFLTRFSLYTLITTSLPYNRYPKRPELQFGVMETDVTDKADMFGVGLVFMYLHKGYHILQYTVTGGKKSYNDFGDQQRQLMHLNLLFQVRSPSGIE